MGNKNSMKKSHLLSLLLFFCVLPNIANAWWNEDWAYRKKITLDTTPVGADFSEAVNQIPMLVRLHTGNFAYFLDIKPNGGDIRFLASDDKTPLKFHIEKLDPLNEVALIWVKLPVISANSNQQSIWMYYGNPNATAATDSGGTYDVNQVAVYHFNEKQAQPQDATAYANHAVAANAATKATALIAAGLNFEGEQSVTLPQAPNIAINPQSGFTFSTWIRPAATNTDAVIFEMNSAGQGLVIGMDASGLYARQTVSNNVAAEARAPALLPDKWQHLAFALSADKAVLYVDGTEVASSAVAVSSFSAAATIGASGDGKNYLTAEIDEVHLSNIARSPAWIAAQVKSEGQASKLFIYSEDESQSSSGGTSYFGVIMRNVTLDGWVVIIILVIMMFISFIVMALKALYLRGAKKDNDAFLQEFYKMDAANDPALLDHKDTDQDIADQNSPIAAAIFGDHDHFQSSPIYHVYHRGIKEVQARLGNAAGAQAVNILSSQSLDAVRASLDATSVRENQKLNNLMVLLTIAISGGPFLGLLGTVVGVMITFAAIAASGDVNINAIAPGIAAALLATVAGLAVAIPALFGYNYLGSRIKEMSADMHVFIDEFITRVGEYYSHK